MSILNIPISTLILILKYGVLYLGPAFYFIKKGPPFPSIGPSMAWQYFFPYDTTCIIYVLYMYNTTPLFGIHVFCILDRPHVCAECGHRGVPIALTNRP